MWAPKKYLVSCAFSLGACEAKALHTIFGNQSQQLLLVLIIIGVVAHRSYSANAICIWSIQLQHKVIFAKIS